MVDGLTVDVWRWTLGEREHVNSHYLFFSSKAVIQGLNGKKNFTLYLLTAYSAEMSSVGRHSSLVTRHPSTRNAQHVIRTSKQLNNSEDGRREHERWAVSGETRTNKKGLLYVPKTTRKNMQDASTQDPGPRTQLAAVSSFCILQYFAFFCKPKAERLHV